MKVTGYVDKRNILALSGDNYTGGPRTTEISQSGLKLAIAAVNSTTQAHTMYTSNSCAPNSDNIQLITHLVERHLIQRDR